MVMEKIMIKRECNVNFKVRSFRRLLIMNRCFYIIFSSTSKLSAINIVKMQSVTLAQEVYCFGRRNHLEKEDIDAPEESPPSPRSSEMQNGRFSSHKFILNCQIQSIKLLLIITTATSIAMTTKAKTLKTEILPLKMYIGNTRKLNELGNVYNVPF